MNVRNPLLWLAAAALLAMGAVCTDGGPDAGDKCEHPGSYSTRTDDNGHRTNLSCEPSGIDRHGKQEYRWTKA